MQFVSIADELQQATTHLNNHMFCFLIYRTYKHLF